MQSYPDLKALWESLKGKVCELKYHNGTYSVSLPPAPRRVGKAISSMGTIASVGQDHVVIEYPNAMVRVLPLNLVVLDIQQES